MNGAIIGLGHGKRVIFEAFKLLNVNLVGVFSKNLEKSIKFSLNNNIKKIFKNSDDLINDKEIEIIAIAVPAYFQINFIKKCLAKNKKIFCEKPILVDSKSFADLSRLLNKSKSKFIVDYIFLEHEAFKKFKKILPRSINKKAKINIIFNFQSYNNKNKIKNWKNFPKFGGGILNLYLSHIMHYLVYFFGKIAKIKKIKKINNSMEIHCVFKSGIIANIIIDSNNKSNEHSIIYEDSKNIISLKNLTKDFAKGFRIHKFIKQKNNKKIIKYEDKINNFKGDGRIYLTKKLINSFFKKFTKKEHIKLINEYLYVEKILNKCRNKL